MKHQKITSFNRAARRSMGQRKAVQGKPVQQDNGEMQRIALLPVLRWFVDNGDEDAASRAQAALDDWNANKQLWISWGANSRYLAMVIRARSNIQEYRKMVRSIPADNDHVRQMNEWVLEAATLLNRQPGVRCKRVA